MDECKHEMNPAFCADCRGLGGALEATLDPFDGLLIDRFYRAAQHEQKCQMSFNGLQHHLIEVGEPFAMAVHDNESGRPPFKRLGYVCADCTDRIAHPRHG